MSTLYKRNLGKVLSVLIFVLLFQRLFLFLDLKVTKVKYQNAKRNDYN